MTARLGSSLFTLIFCSAGLFSLTSSLTAAEEAGKKDTSEPVSYFKQIRPVLQRQCQGCHQPATKQADLMLTSYESFKAGGHSGPAFVPRDPDKSLVMAYLKGDRQPRMPLGGDPLTADQIGFFQRWIEAGAVDDTPEVGRDTVAAGKPPVYTIAPAIVAVTYSPDGNLMAVSGYREVLLHKSDGSELVARLVGVSDRIQSIVFSPDGKLMAAVGGTPARFGEVQIWDLETHQLKRSITVSSDTLFGASFSPDGSKLAFGCADNTTRIVDVQSGKELQKMTHHDNWVFGTVFSVDGKRLVSVGRDRAVKLTDVNTGAFIENLNQLRGELDCVARHPKKDIVLVGGADRLPLLYMMTRPRAMRVGEESTLIRQFEKQPGKIVAAAFRPDGQKIAVGGASNEVAIYNTEDGQKTATLTGFEGELYALAFNPKGDRLAAAGFDGKVRIYDAETGKLVTTFIPVPLEKPAISMK
jgi:WD40 repeat protein